MSTRSKGFFVTGTDTGVGKTVVAVGLVHALVQRGLRVGVMKPVAAGAEPTSNGLRNEDAVRLMEAANVEVDYDIVNPYCLALPASPHIAAREAGTVIELSTIVRCFEHIAARADCVVVEGAGGWLAPIGDSSTMADIAVALSLPVVMVVGLRLGCLNHALLTAHAVRDSGLALRAWVGNEVNPYFSQLADNLATLEHRLALAPAAVLPHGPRAGECEREAALALAALASTA